MPWNVRFAPLQKITGPVFQRYEPSASSFEKQRKLSFRPAHIENDLLAFLYGDDPRGFQHTGFHETVNHAPDLDLLPISG